MDTILIIVAVSGWVTAIAVWHWYMCRVKETLEELARYRNMTCNLAFSLGYERTRHRLAEEPLNKILRVGKKMSYRDIETGVKLALITLRRKEK